VEKKPKQKKGLKDEDLEESVAINLSETPTTLLFFMYDGIIKVGHLHL